MARVKRPQGEGAPAKEVAANSVRGSDPPTATKAKNSGSRAGAQRRGKQKPEAQRAAQSAAAPPQKCDAGQKPAGVAEQPGDATATIQLSPHAASLHVSASQRDQKGPEQPSTETTRPSTEMVRVAEQREGAAKAKAAKRKASKAPEATSLQQLTKTRSSNLSGRASPVWEAFDRNAEETTAPSGVEGAARPEPVTQSATPELTPVQPGVDALPCTGGPSPIRLSNSPVRGHSRAAQGNSRPPPLESLMPMAGPQRHSVKVCCAMLILL